MRIGSRIWFAGEKRPYRVRASGTRYAVCTKPFNLQKTVLYTVVDLHEKVRGTENLVFGLGAETDEQCQEMLARIVSGETRISHRNRVALRIERTA